MPCSLHTQRTNHAQPERHHKMKKALTTFATVIALVASAGSSIAGPLGNTGPCAGDTHRAATTNSDDQRYDTGFSLGDVAAGEMFGSLEIGNSRLSSNLNTCLANAGVSAEAYDVTLSARWVADNQLYIDGQVRYGHFDGELSLNGQNMVGFDGDGYEASVEVGQSFELLNDVTLIPQAQLKYSDIEGQIGTGRFGAKVDGDTLMARVGLRAEYALADNATLYGQIDVYHAFDTENSMVYGQDTAAISVGGIVTKSDRAQLYAELTSETGLGSNAGNHTVSWNIGYEVRF